MFRPCFKAPWRKMEMVDKIETLVSIEKDIAAHRQELCKGTYGKQ